MVRFDASTLTKNGEDYFYGMQKGDTVYSIADKIAKEQGGNAADICNQLIWQSNLTTNAKDSTKAHVNRVPVGYQINLGKNYGAYLSKFMPPDSDTDTRRQARRFASAFSTDPRYTDADACRDFAMEIGTDPACNSSGEMPRGPVVNGRPIIATGQKHEYTPAELQALQGNPRDEQTPRDPAPARQNITLGSDTIAAKPDGDSAQEKIDEAPEHVVPERQAPDDTAEWTPDGTLEPELSAADLETLRQLGEARAEDDPIHYDPATGLDMSSYMVAYTDSERSAVRENLKYSLQELRAADRIEELGSFDTTKFAAIKHEGMYVLLPFGLDQQEAGALADYLRRFHRIAPVETRRAFSVVSQAAAARRASGHSIINDPVPVEDTSVAGNQKRQPLFDMNKVTDELFRQADADPSVMADVSDTPKK